MDERSEINPYRKSEARNIVPPTQTYNNDKILIRAGAIIILTGVMLFFIGAILFQTIWLMDSDDYDEYGEYYDDFRVKAGYGRILNWIGALLIVFPLYLIGVSCEKLDWKVRASMLSTATAIVIATLIVTMFITFPSSIHY